MGTIPDVVFRDNTEERLPLVLVLDCSGSMSGEPIKALNESLKVLENELKADPITSKRVRLLIITFGDDNEVRVVGEWKDVMDFTAPVLEANGRTPIGKAVSTALEEIESLKEKLRNAGIPYKRPLLYLMSDGVPTDDWKSVAEACRKAEKDGKLSVFPIAVGEECNIEVLGAFAERGAMKLDGLKFKELFLWVSNSAKVVSRTTTGQTAQIAPVDSWAQVQTK